MERHITRRIIGQAIRRHTWAKAEPRSARAVPCYSYSSYSSRSLMSAMRDTGATEKRKRMLPSLIAEDEEEVAAKMASISLKSIGQSPSSLAPPPIQRDGIDFSDALLVPREELVLSLIEHRQKRLLVTAPPASGKSSLIQLIRQRLEKQEQKKSVLVIRGIEAPSPKDYPSGGWEKAMKEWIDREVKEECGKLLNLPDRDVTSLRGAMAHFDYILIDDAQRLYAAPSIWEGIVKSENKTRVIFFASITLQADGSANAPAVPGRLSWADLRLTDDESHSLLTRLLAHPHVVKYHSAWAPTVLPLLCRDAAGHVGLIRLLADELFIEFRPLSKVTATEEKVMRYYQGGMYNAYITERFFTDPGPLSDDCLSVIDRLLRGEKVVMPRVMPRYRNGNRIESSESAAVRWLLRNVVVVSVPDTDIDAYGRSCQERIEFATPIHRNYFLRKIYPTKIC